MNYDNSQGSMFNPLPRDPPLRPEALARIEQHALAVQAILNRAIPVRDLNEDEPPS